MGLLLFLVVPPKESHTPKDVRKMLETTCFVFNKYISGNLKKNPLVLAKMIVICSAPEIDRIPEGWLSIYI